MFCSASEYDAKEPAVNSAVKGRANERMITNEERMMAATRQGSDGENLFTSRASAGFGWFINAMSNVKDVKDVTVEIVRYPRTSGQSDEALRPVRGLM